MKTLVGLSGPGARMRKLPPDSAAAVVYLAEAMSQRELALTRAPVGDLPSRRRSRSADTDSSSAALSKE